MVSLDGIREVAKKGIDWNDVDNWVVEVQNMLKKCAHKVFVEMPKREKKVVKLLKLW